MPDKRNHDSIYVVGIVILAGEALRMFCGKYGQEIRKSGLLIFHHVRMDTILLIDALIEEGVSVLRLVGPSYSLEPGALDAFKVRCVDVEVLDHADVTLRAAEILGSMNVGEIGLIDTGGYCASLVKYRFPKFIVELTNRGLWRYQEEDVHRLIHFAAARNKAVENVFIGRAIARAVRTELVDRRLRQSTIGVVGYGGVGSNVALALRDMGYTVCVFDIDPLKRMLASVNGFLVLGQMDILRVCGVVVGCTGTDCYADLEFDLQNEVLFFSGSSRQIEWRSVIDRRNAFVVNDGFPINLKHESLPIEIAEHLFLNVCAAVVHGNTIDVDGFQEIDGGLQRDANEIWISSYGLDKLREMSEPRP